MDSKGQLEDSWVQLKRLFWNTSDRYDLNNKPLYAQFAFELLFRRSPVTIQLPTKTDNKIHLSFPKPIKIEVRTKSNLFFNIWAGVDCLESLALNVSTDFASMNVFWHSVWEERTVSLMTLLMHQTMHPTCWKTDAQCTNRKFLWTF